MLDYPTSNITINATMFTQSSFSFLHELEHNNNREWFKANQDRYENTVRTPALMFIEAMQPHIQGLSPRLTAVAKKVGGSLMRPQRDSRFSKDKTPYKTNVGIQFRHFQGKDVHAPGLYIHIANDSCFVGAGVWHPDSKSLNKIRTCIDENPKAYLKAISQLSEAGFTMAGDSLIRPPKGFDKTHPLLDELKRKDFIAVKEISAKQVTSSNFEQFCNEQFTECQRLMHYLCFALELDY